MAIISVVAVTGIIEWRKSISESEVENIDDISEAEPEYTIYLYSEYSRFSIGMEIDIIATLNFETDAVNSTAHLASGKEDTVSGRMTKVKGNCTDCLKK